MDWLSIMRSAITVMAFASFIGIVWWAYSARRQTSFQAAARLALEDERYLHDRASGNAVAEGG
jgi:cbb3-type cytochrome oxidase subunit 3